MKLDGKLCYRALLCAGVSTGLLAHSALAQQSSTYIGEVAGKAGFVDDDADTKYINASATLYLDPVKENVGPLAEAAFLNRATNFYVYDTITEYYDDNAQDFGIGGEIYIPNSMFYAAASYNRHKDDGNGDGTVTVKAGITPVYGLRLLTAYTEDEGYDLNMEAKYILDLPGAQALNLEAGFRDDDSNTITAAVDFYINSHSSIGVATVDTGADTTYTFRGKHFFTNRFYVGGALTSADAGDSFEVNTGFRF